MGIMSGLAALGRVAGGFMDGRRQAEEDQQRADDRAFQTLQRNRMQQQWKRDDQLQAGLQDAVKPVVAQELAGPPTDAGAGPGFRMGDQNFPTQEAASAQLNSPQAQQRRMSMAYQAAGMPEKAMALDTAARQGRVADLQEQQLLLGDQHKKMMTSLFDAYHGGGWNAVADWSTKNYDDGKTYKVLNASESGPATIGVFDAGGNQVKSYTYKNFGEALGQVGGRMDPAKWLADQVARGDTEAKQQLERDKVDIARGEAADKGRLINAQVTYYGARANRMDAGSGAAGSDPANPTKIPQPVMEQYKGMRKEFDLMNAEVRKAQAAGMWDTSTNAAQAKFHKEMGDLELAMRNTLAPYLPQPGGGAGGGAQQDPFKLREGLTKNTQQQTPAPPPAAPTAAPDPTARRVKTTPVVDFTANSGQRMRMNTARASLPDLEQAVRMAQQAVVDAQSRGPLAVQRARDLLSRAKTDLQMASDRAGQ